MGSLLAIEWLKIKRYRTFWVLVGLFALLLPLWNYSVANGFLKLGGSGKNGMNFLNTAYSFPEVWSNVGFWGSIFILFLAILVIIVTTNENAYRTNRQNVIDGWKRIEFYHAKVQLVVALSVLVTVYYAILSIVFGIANSGSFSFSITDLRSISYFFLLSLDYLGLALFLSIWVRRSGLAIGLFLLYSMIIENIARGMINHYFDTPYGNLLPLQASDELLPFPLMMMTKALLNQVDKIANTTYLIATLCWCGVYYVAGRALLLRKDW
ncbi:MAG: ABC transporter permease [Bacteroidota bacterium]